ncbi:MAG: hypothetical protein LBS42_04295 [Tannerella sp.]|jgi:hypothetical protein|nr:hypothetical protein [Tannerella sp.]
MSIPIRSVPLLEGEVARRFIKEAKANEKKRGTYKFSEEDKVTFCRIINDYKKYLENSENLESNLL